MVTPQDRGADHRYWFAPKRVGVGWGLPTAWQGWVLLVTYLTLVIVTGVAAPSALAYVVIPATVLFVVVVVLTGDPAGRRWAGGRRRRP